MGTLISEKLRPLAGRVIRGIRDRIPAGYILGRLDDGEGPVQLIRLRDILNSTAELTFDELTSKPAIPVDWKDSVRAASTANGTLATAFENGDSMDGVTLATGDRILLKDQSTGAENGIYTVNASGAPTRATDADADNEVTSMLTVAVEEGTTNAGTTWQLTTTGAIVVDTTALTFAQLGGGSSGLTHPQVMARGLL